MDGVLVIDKPTGPTSHDVVARVRRAIGERRVGHTGTLDPFATGVLPLVVGRATRLARFFSGSDKSYEARLRLGIGTDTHDLTGLAVGGVRLGRAGAELPRPEAIESALDAFRGRFLQRPPAFSAKKVAGVRSYDVARRQRRDAGEDTPLAPALDPVEVTVHALSMTGAEDDLVTLRMTVSAGFYVRALAHDLGERLGCGAHLVSLRRTATGDFDERDALALDLVEREGADVVTRMVPLERLLPRCPVVRLTPSGLVRATHGNEVDASHCASDERPEGGSPTWPAVRLFGPDGRLVAIARQGRPGAAAAPPGAWPLHPAIVLT